MKHIGFLIIFTLDQHSLNFGSQMTSNPGDLFLLSLRFSNKRKNKKNLNGTIDL